jgi:hypothetical protein
MTEDTDGDRRLYRRTLLKSTLLASGLAGCFSGDDRSQPTDSPTRSPPEQSPPTATSPPPSTEQTPTTATDDPTQPTQTETPPPDDPDVMDRLIFGNEPSENDHDFSPESSRVIEGKDGHRARQITLPYQEAGFDLQKSGGYYEEAGFNDEGHEEVVGSCSFTIDCDPDAQNYITLKFQQETPKSWGKTPFVTLWHGNQQIGWTKMNPDWAGGTYNRRITGEWAHFTYVLPQALTEGKESIELHLGTFDTNWNIIGTGPVVYRAYSHTDALFDLPSDEQPIDNRNWGEPWGPDRDGDIDTAIDILQEGIENSVQKAQNGNLGNEPTKSVRDLAYARNYDWIESYDVDAALNVIQSYIDGKVIERANGTDVAEQFPNTHNWGTHGRLARAFVELADVFEERGLLGEPIDGHPEDIPRGQAYANFWAAAWQWRDSSHAGPITNQIQFVNEGLIAMADALDILDPERAPPEERVDLWIDEMVGLAPVGPSWHIHSEAGLNEEPGYSIGHGVSPYIHLAWLAHDTDVDRVNERLKDFTEANGWLRWRGKSSSKQDQWWDTSVWKDRRTMVQAGRLSSRGGGRWPGYAHQWMGYSRAPAALAALGSDASDAEALKRWAELLVEHGPIMQWVSGLQTRLRQVLGMAQGLRDLKDMEPSTYELPWERDRAVWSDPDQAIVSIVDGDARLQATLGHGHRSPYQTNYVAFDYNDLQTARPGGTVLRRNEFPEAGTTQMGGGFFTRLGGGLSNDAYVAWAGEEQAISQYFEGQERPYADREGVWYQSNSHQMRLYYYREADIGPYRIGINPTGGEVVERRVIPEGDEDATETLEASVGTHRGFGPDQVFEMEVPDGGAIDLETGEEVSGTVTVGPRETRVLKRSEE